MTGTFYIVRQKIVFCRDSSDRVAFDHIQLFPSMLKNLFPALDPATFRQLCSESMYSIPRGRVSAYRGKFTLYGGVECREVESRLRSIFGLSPDVTADYSDPHYATMKTGRWLIQDVLREQRGRFVLLPDEIEIVGLKRRHLIADDVHLDDPQEGGTNTSLRDALAVLGIRLSQEHWEMISTLTPREMETLRERAALPPVAVESLFKLTPIQIEKIVKRAAERERRTRGIRFSVPIEPQELEAAYVRGMIRKSDLEDGVIYRGFCRGSDTARWSAAANTFQYVDELHRIRSLRHPEDDEGFDLFVPFEKRENV